MHQYLCISYASLMHLLCIYLPPRVHQPLGLRPGHAVHHAVEHPGADGSDPAAGVRFHHRVSQAYRFTMDVWHGAPQLGRRRLIYHATRGDQGPR